MNWITGNIKWIIVAAIVSGLGFVAYKGIDAWNDRNAVIEDLTEDLQRETANRIKVEETNAVNEATIKRMTQDRIRQAELQKQLDDRLITAEEYARELQRILSEHNLTYLAKERPGLIERRINDATSNVFDSIQCDTGGLCD